MFVSMHCAMHFRLIAHAHLTSTHADARAHVHALAQCSCSHAHGHTHAHEDANAHADAGADTDAHADRMPIASAMLVIISSYLNPPVESTMPRHLNTQFALFLDASLD